MGLHRIVPPIRTQIFRRHDTVTVREKALQQRQNRRADKLFAINSGQGLTTIPRSGILSALEGE